MATSVLEWSGATSDQLEVGLRHIVETSMSEEEILTRIKDELGYEGTVSLYYVVPNDVDGLCARAIGRSLGGLVSGNGAMVMVMMWCHDGTIVQM